MTPIRAVIFDMDGLMFDTEHMILDELPKVAAQCGLHLPRELVNELIGCDSRKVNLFEKEYPGIIQAMAWYQEHRMEIFYRYFKRPGAANKPGLQELVEALEQMDMPYAVASSSSHHDIQAMLDFAGFPIHPQVIVSSKEGIASKPSPDIFLVTARKLGIKPVNALVLEDSKFGIMAAGRAHMRSIFIPDVIVPDEEMKEYIQETRTDLAQVIPYLQKKQKK
ncbi:MAG: HAD family hydrolase [Catenisphaera adipataccumulans]|jgi:HAD superfamily hydrolase (TIGR01509 family)|uniref:HAD family hydrolase n=1 Tax=Catenisphaera adipataccumulans TaxID=700500 RepID=UPI003D8EFA64